MCNRCAPKLHHSLWLAYSTPLYELDHVFCCPVGAVERLPSICNRCAPKLHHSLWLAYSTPLYELDHVLCCPVGAVERLPSICNRCAPKLHHSLWLAYSTPLYELDHVFCCPVGAVERLPSPRTDVHRPWAFHSRKGACPHRAFAHGRHGRFQQPQGAGERAWQGAALSY